MRYRRTLLLASGLLIASATQAWAQAYGSTVGNFLNAPVTPQGLAMGEASASVVTNNAMSIIANPSLLGMQGLNNKLEIGSSLSSLRNSNGHYSFLVSTASYGIQANSIWHDLPFKAGIGVGYSYEESTFPFNPTAPVKSGYVTNYANSLAVGLGFDYFVKLGLGYSVKLIKNKNEVAPIYPNINQPAGDFGAIIQIPVLLLLHGSERQSIIDDKNIRPIFNITAGYSLRNVSGYVIKGPGYELPLARQAALGWNWELALRSRVAGYKWKWFSFTWDREAVNAPFRADSASLGVGSNGATNWNYFWSYRDGPGTFSPWNNLVLGRGSVAVSESKGWQVGLGGFFYLRGGAITYPGGSTNETSGWGARLEGLVRALMFFHSLDQNVSIIQFILKHLDLRFDYTASNAGIYPGQPFYSLDLILK